MINAMDPPLYFGIKFGKCLYTTFYLNRLREKGNRIYFTGGYVWSKFDFTCGLEWYLQNSSLRYIISLCGFGNQKLESGMIEDYT